MSETPKSSSPLAILLAWLVVVIPGTWGVYYTVLGAIKLFQ